MDIVSGEVSPSDIQLQKRALSRARLALKEKTTVIRILFLFRFVLKNFYSWSVLMMKKLIKE
jgi:hypothetical protein